MESNTYRYGRGELTSNKIDDYYALLETFKYETRSLIIDDNPYIPKQGTQNRVLLVYKRKWYIICKSASIVPKDVYIEPPDIPIYPTSAPKGWVKLFVDI